MSTIRLALRNLLYKPWNTALSLILATLGAGLISLLLLVSWQLEQQFERNLAEINLVIGAKGSPLQLILSSMYHVDAPTGNIEINDIKPFLNPNHPYVERAVPLSLGDSYQGRRIVGTTPDIFDLYQTQIAKGKGWDKVMEVVIGARVAEDLQLRLGDQFQSTHGLEEDSLLVHEDAEAFKVAGILEPAGNVIDQLILTSTHSVWAVHADHDHDHDGHDHDGHDHEEHSHAEHNHDEHDHGEHDHNDHDGHNHEGHDHDGHDHGEHDHAATTASMRDVTVPLSAYPEEQITSLLLQFKGNSVFSLNLQRSINEDTKMQAATPSIEINRLYATMGPGETILRRIALAIVLVSIFSIFISLYTSLDDRRKELALMRSLGGSRTTLLGLLLTEGVILAVGGALLGLLLSHTSLYLIAQFVSAKYRYDFASFFLLPAEGWLLAIAFGIGIVAALIPALRAANTDVHSTLAEG
ncbi:MAG: ABC transporter permease [Bacteroidota bacterium]